MMKHWPDAFPRASKGNFQSRKLHSGAPPRKPPPPARSETLTAAFPSVPAIVALNSLDILHHKADLIAKIRAVALGTSTGGPRAVQEILPLFPRDLAVPILIVQHLPPGFTAPFAQRLNTFCSVSVREATHGECIQPVVIYIAPAGVHMRVERPSDSRAIIFLDTHPDDYLHIPSIDVLMTSVAETFRNLALGVIMTGMGSDGSAGMQAIYRQGRHRPGRI